jgi:hypothetical protein
MNGSRFSLKIQPDATHSNSLRPSFSLPSPLNVVQMEQGQIVDEGINNIVILPRFPAEVRRLPRFAFVVLYDESTLDQPLIIQFQL